MRGKVFPGPVSGTVSVPPSKSFMQRAVACAVLSDCETNIIHPSLSADGRAALGLAAGLGADVRTQGEKVSIRPGCREPEKILNARESGLSLRMFASIAARLPLAVTIEASGTLRHRPVGMMENSFRQLGVLIESNDGLPPIYVKGPLHGGEVDVDGALTSQFLSGLLIALPACSGNSKIRVSNLTSRPYVEMTLSVLKSFGVQWQVETGTPTVFRTIGGQRFCCPEFNVPGDWSSAAGILIVGAIAGSVTVRGLPQDRLQGDRAVLEVLKKVGAFVSVSENLVRVSKNHLDAFQVDITHCPDLVPVLVALAAHCRGESTITGTSRLKFKESDRALVLQREFGKLGAEINLTEDVMRITGSPLHSGHVDASGDHRIAMALTIAALGAEGLLEINGVDCLDKSYPGFFEDLTRIGVRIEMDARGQGG